MGDLLGAASLLLAVLAVLQGLWNAEIERAESTPVPEHRPNRTIPRRDITRVLWSKAAPLAVASVLLTAVLVPDAVEIGVEAWQRFQASGLEARHDYDAVKATFGLVVVFTACFSLATTLRALRLLGLVRRLR